MKAPRKTKRKSGSGNAKKENDQLSKTRKRLDAQKKALQKIIEKFSKKENDK